MASSSSPICCFSSSWVSTLACNLQVLNQVHIPMRDEVHIPSIYIQLLEEFQKNLNFLCLHVEPLEVIDMPPINVFIRGLTECHVRLDAVDPLIKAGLNLNVMYKSLQVVTIVGIHLHLPQSELDPILEAEKDWSIQGIEHPCPSCLHRTKCQQPFGWCDACIGLALERPWLGPLGTNRSHRH